MSAKTQEQEEREGHQRFARMFEGIEDSSDDESANGVGEEDEGVDVGKVEEKKEGDGKGKEKEGDNKGKEKEEGRIVV